jgi:hypothetical protein
MEKKPPGMIGWNVEPFGENGHVKIARTALFKTHDGKRDPEIISS